MMDFVGHLCIVRWCWRLFKYACKLLLSDLTVKIGSWSIISQCQLPITGFPDWFVTLLGTCFMLLCLDFGKIFSLVLSGYSFRKRSILLNFFFCFIVSKILFRNVFKAVATSELLSLHSFIDLLWCVLRCIQQLLQRVFDN